MRLLTLNSVLVATDLAATSDPAIRTAARLAPLAGASLHLLHVAADRTAVDEVRLAEHYRQAAPDEAAPSSIRVMTGDPATAIVEHAGSVGADVVIVGPHRRGTNSGDLGSTARSVVATAPCPCLVAATDLRLPLERVLVPIDDSLASSGALALALSWASALRSPGGTADLLAIHVSRNSGQGDAPEALSAEMERLRHITYGVAAVSIREKLIAGEDPAAEILHEAAASTADLLVMGTRAPDERPRELGSVSGAVVRDVPCPLLLVPPRHVEHLTVMQ